ncbi:MAG: hypothetical protein ACRDKV_10150 [Solirubrobacterales bacterium]
MSSAGERIQVIIEAAEKAAAGIIEDADAQAHHYIEASRERADTLADERVRVMSDLTDTLIRQAEIVRKQSDELLAALDSARGELATRIGQELSTGPGAAGAESPGAAGAGPSQQRVPHLQPVESGRPDLQAVAPAPELQPPPPQAQPQAPPAPAPQQSTPPPAPPASGGPADASGTTSSDGARLLAAQMAVAGSSRKEIEARLRDEFGIQDAGPILDGILGPS